MVWRRKYHHKGSKNAPGTATACRTLDFDFDLGNQPFSNDKVVLWFFGIKICTFQYIQLRYTWIIWVNHSMPSHLNQGRPRNSSFFFLWSFPLGVRLHLTSLSNWEVANRTNGHAEFWLDLRSCRHHDLDQIVKKGIVERESDSMVFRLFDDDGLKFDHTSCSRMQYAYHLV